MAIWVYEIIVSLFNYIIICGVCTWYFTSTQDSTGEFSLCKGLGWALRYNFGSLAFGSILVSLVWGAKMTFEWVAKKIDEPENPLTRCLESCCRCCLDCFHRFIKFIDENAYIQIALTSDPFCTAAYSAFCLALKNSTTFMITNGIGTMMRFLGRVSICLANTFIGYLIIENVSDLKEDIDNPIVMLSIIFLISFTMSSVFMDVYAIVSLTMLQCLYVDIDICNQNREPDVLNNRYRPAEMQDIVETLSYKEAE